MICDALFDILFYKLILEKIYSILAYFGVLTAWVGGITILLFSPLMIYLEMYYLMIIYFCIIGYQYIVGYCVEIKFLKRFTSKYYRKYFKDSKLIFDEPSTLNLNLPYIFCYHPHGIMCISYVANGALNADMDKFKVSWLIADFLFNLPLFLFSKIVVNLDGVNKNNMMSLMKNRKNIGLLPGGFHEISLFEKYKHIVYIKNKKGFVKMALVNGYNLIPVYCFGEERLYSGINLFPRKLSLYLSNRGIPTSFPIGKFGIPFFADYNEKLKTVVGKPVKLPQIENPSQQDIDYYHEIYCSSLKDLFNKYREDHDGDLIIY